MEINQELTEKSVKNTQRWGKLTATIVPELGLIDWFSVTLLKPLRKTFKEMFGTPDNSQYDQIVVWSYSHIDKIVSALDNGDSVIVVLLAFLWDLALLITPY